MTPFLEPISLPLHLTGVQINEPENTGTIVILEVRNVCPGNVTSRHPHITANVSFTDREPQRMVSPLTEICIPKGQTRSIQFLMPADINRVVSIWDINLDVFHVRGVIRRDMKNSSAFPWVITPD